MSASVAQVDDIHRTTLGQLRNKTIFSGRRKIAHIGPTPVTECTTTANHHVRVNIDGIDGVGHANKVIPMQQLLEVTRIALRSVVDKDLVYAEMYASRQEVILQDGLAQKVIALLRAITAETLDSTHLVGSLMHGLHHGRCQRLRHVANTQ